MTPIIHYLENSQIKFKETQLRKVKSGKLNNERKSDLGKTFYFLSFGFNIGRDEVKNQIHQNMFDFYFFFLHSLP
jgi:hypothetical protein